MAAFLKTIKKARKKNSTRASATKPKALGCSLPVTIAIAVTIRKAEKVSTSKRKRFKKTGFKESLSKELLPLQPI